MQLPIYVTTCDSHRELVHGWAELFNRHWLGQKVTVLGFLPPTGSLPTNFRFVSMGKQEDFGKFWTDPIANYLRTVADDILAIFMEDFVFVSDMNEELLRRAIGHIQSGVVHKVEIGALRFDARRQATIFSQDDAFYLAPPSWVSWTLAAIWKREHLLTWLPSGLDCWQQNELANTIPFSEGSGTRGLIPYQSLAQVIEVIKGGKARPNVWEGYDGRANESMVSAADREVILRMMDVMGGRA